MTTPIRTPSTSLQWSPHNASHESAILDMANSRQIALRTRLRNHYWLTDCKPIGQTTVAFIRKKMAMIDGQDVMSDDEVAEVLSDHFGFDTTAEGLTIPDLMEARETAISASQARHNRAVAGGQARALRAATASQGAPKHAPAPDPEDF